MGIKKYIRNLSKFAIVNLIVVIAVILILEITCRVFSKSERQEYKPPFTYDKESFYRLIPNISMDYYGVKININSFGFRGEEFNLEKDRNTYRILCLGDSVTFGFRLPIEQTFPFLLCEGLNKDGTEGIYYEVLNGAVPGYCTLQEDKLLRAKGERISPDLVILNVVLNDIVMKKRTYLIKKFLASSAFFNFLERKHVQMKRLFLREKFKLKRSEEEQEFANFYNLEYNDSLEISEQESREWEKQLIDIKKYCEKIQSRLLVVIFPLAPQVEEGVAATAQARIALLCRRNMIPYLDLLPELKKVYSESNKSFYAFDVLVEETKEDKPKTFNDIAHFNKYGNKVIAEIVQDYLREHEGS